MPWPKGKKFSAEHIAKRSASIIDSGARRKKPVALDGVDYWKCGTCKIYKPVSEYYEDGKTVAGIASVCKACHTKGCIATRDRDNARQANVLYMRRARVKDPEKFRERERLSAEKKRQNSPQKVAARNAVNAAVKRGELLKPTDCEMCGQQRKVAGHHDDYSKPLQVRWLCAACHGKEHRVVEFKRVLPCK